MSVIITKYLSPKTNRPARVRAVLAPGWGNGIVTLNWDHALSGSDNHKSAAVELASKLKLSGEFTGVSVSDGYLFIRDNALTPVFTVVA